ncbi:MAG: hypothetical protein JSS89_01055 [Bacteroidetes bacterium]|nr:hypothetical protein [Bacteroidota bacterium]
MPHLLELLRTQELAGLVSTLTSLLRTHATRSDALVTPKGVEAVRAVLPEDHRAYAATLIDLCVGAQKAERLGKAQGAWLFTSVGAEQATHPDIARVHAELFDGCTMVVEVCTGSGLDTQAIAARVGRVVSFEADPIVAALAQGNLRRAGIHNVDVINAAVPCDAWEQAMEQADGLWADPSRRTPSGKRTRSIAHHDPPLALLTTHPRIPFLRAVGIKLGPADDVPASLMRGLCRDYIGSGNECKELVLRTRTSYDVSATLVEGKEVRRIMGDANTGSRIQNAMKGSVNTESHNVSHSVSHEVLFEPHATLIASGLLTAVYRDHGIRPIDPQIAYGLASIDPGPSVWWTRFRVVAVDEGVSEKRMQVRIRELEWNKHTEFKKRGWPRDPEELRHALSFPASDHHGVVFIVRVGDGHRTYYAQRMD